MLIQVENEKTRVTTYFIKATWSILEDPIVSIYLYYYKGRKLKMESGIEALSCFFGFPKLHLNSIINYHQQNTQNIF